MKTLDVLIFIAFGCCVACQKRQVDHKPSPSAAEVFDSRDGHILDETSVTSDIALNNSEASEPSGILDAFFYLKSHGDKSGKYLKVICKHEPEDAMLRKIGVHFYSHRVETEERVDTMAEQQLRVPEVMFNLTGLINTAPEVSAVAVTCLFENMSESLAVKIERSDKAKPSSAFQLRFDDGKDGEKVVQGIDIVTDDADIPYNTYYGHGQRRLILKEGDVQTNYIVPNWSEGLHDLFTLVRLSHIFKEDTPSEKLSLERLCQAQELQIVPTNWDSLGKNLGPDYESTIYNTMKMANDSDRVRYFKAQCAQEKRSKL